MCELTAIIGLASSIVGGIGQMQQANAQARAAEYNAAVADMNAKISERRAKDAIERGQNEEQLQRMKTADLQGKQRAAMAANGVDIGFGSPLDTLVDTAYLGELDALTIRRNTAREAYDFRVQGMNQSAEGELKRMEAKSARTGGALAAVGTILGGAGQAYGNFRKSRIGSIA